MEKQLRPLHSDRGAPDVLEELRAESLSERVFDAIRSAIVNKSVPPGVPLTEAGLATQLNVSKTPVREALLRLRQIGLIEPDGRRGGRVVRPSRDALEHTYEVREALEVFTARAAAERATAAQKQEIVDAAERSARAANEDDLDEYIRWDGMFHARITAVAGNPRLTELIESAFALILALRSRDAQEHDVSVECGRAHVAIAEAIDAGDAAGAEERMREHIRHVRDFVVSVFDATAGDESDVRESRA
jgi:DNA-binding GntR family transcriptional regulator